MENLFTYINFDEDNTRPLVGVAIARVKFETIHPFVDGKQRNRRFLIYNVVSLMRD